MDINFLFYNNHWKSTHMGRASGQRHVWCLNDYVTLDTQTGRGRGRWRTLQQQDRQWVSMLRAPTVHILSILPPWPKYQTPATLLWSPLQGFMWDVLQAGPFPTSDFNPQKQKIMAQWSSWIAALALVSFNIRIAYLRSKGNSCSWIEVHSS